MSKFYPAAPGEVTISGIQLVTQTGKRLVSAPTLAR